MEPHLKPARTTPQPSQNLVEPWWNHRGTLVEPYLKPPRTTPQPSQNLVEPWWNPGGTLVKPWWNLRGTLPQTTPDHPAALADGGTLVEPWWNLSSGSPRTTPEPIWAETPKLSAVGEKRKIIRPSESVLLLGPEKGHVGNGPKTSAERTRPERTATNGPQEIYCCCCCCCCH